jgi:hypothetical protein
MSETQTTDPERYGASNAVREAVAQERERCIALVKRWEPDECGCEHPLVTEIRNGMRVEDANS